MLLIILATDPILAQLTLTLLDSSWITSRVGGYQRVRFSFLITLCYQPLMRIAEERMSYIGKRCNLVLIGNNVNVVTVCGR